MAIERKIKSNDLGSLFEGELRAALQRRGSLFWRLHTIRSFKGVCNPCDFVVLDKDFAALLECKATADVKFSCSGFQQLKHFETSAQRAHAGLYGVIVYFYSSVPCYVYAGDKKVLENKQKRRPIRATVPDSYDVFSLSLDDLLDSLSKL